MYYWVKKASQKSVQEYTVWYHLFLNTLTQPDYVHMENGLEEGILYW